MDPSRRALSNPFAIEDSADGDEDDHVVLAESNASEVDPSCESNDGLFYGLSIDEFRLRLKLAYEGMNVGSVNRLDGER